jgi:hypothetical protein
LLALGGFALATRVRGAGEHRIFGGHPAFTLATQPWRQPVFDAGGAQHLRVAEADENAALGMFGESGLDENGAHFVWRASGWAHVLVPFDGINGAALIRR